MIRRISAVVAISLTLAIGLLSSPASASDLTGEDPLTYGCTDGVYTAHKGRDNGTGNRWEVRKSNKCGTTWLRVDVTQPATTYYYLATYSCAAADSSCRLTPQRVTATSPGLNWTDMATAPYIRACKSSTITTGPFDSCSSPKSTEN